MYVYKVVLNIHQVHSSANAFIMTNTQTLYLILLLCILLVEVLPAHVLRQ